MKRKVPETMGACFALIERDMLKGPWVMGEQYTICDPYLYHAGRLAGGRQRRSCDLPKVAAHRKRMSERPAVQKVMARRRRRTCRLGKRSVPDRAPGSLDGGHVDSRLCPRYVATQPSSALHLAADAEHELRSQIEPGSIWARVG